MLQITTPFSVGTGFYLPEHDLVVTNEHVVRDNPNVMVLGENDQQQLMPVVYLDAHYDLAFLRPSVPIPWMGLHLAQSAAAPGDSVLALGYASNNRPQSSEGVITEQAYVHEEIEFIQHSARLDSTQSGGPLLDVTGALLGVNMFDLDEEQGLSLALPAAALLKCLTAFARGEGRSATRCFNCHKVVFEPRTGRTKFCPGCGASIVLPPDVPEYQPTGLQATVEEIISCAGYDPRPARRGPNLWEIRQGSARIFVAYHEDSGLLTGDAHLCKIPDERPDALFEYLLHENYTLEQLTFSTYGRDVILSLLVYDRYLSIETALPRFQRLFERADHYDNYLVERFGANWK